MTTNRWALLLALGLLLAPGCITFDGQEQRETRVLVTQDVGTEILVDETVTVQAGSTAMDALREVATVETSHGGGFVEAIDGIESRYPAERVDWFYHVNTRLADVGAAQYELSDDDLVVFDHRSWEQTMHLPHVLTGLGEWPTDLDEASFDREAFEQRQADEHDRSSLYAHVDGRTLTVLDADGQPARKLSAPWVLAHAVDGPGEDPEILLVASDEEARLLVDELADTSPTGVGTAVTPNGTVEVPTG